MTCNSRQLIIVFSIVIVLFSGLIFRLKHSQQQQQTLPVKQRLQLETNSTMSQVSTLASTVTSRLRPIYFVSHGGPTFMYREDEMGDAGAFDQISSIGKALLEDPPKALVVVSAHWQEEYAKSPNGLPTIGITSTDGENSLIYDFYGFPKHMYKEEFHTRGSKQLSRYLAEKLSTTADGKPAFNAKLYGSRGFDHGLWVPFRVAFPQYSIQGDKNYVPFPVVQISLPSSPSGMRSRSPLDIQYETEVTHKLGTQLKELRDRLGDDIAIVCSGMSVHNLRDMWEYMGGVAPYGKRFEERLKAAVSEGPLSDRLEKLTSLFKDPVTREAHPTLEHIAPIAVALGAAEEFTPSIGADATNAETKLTIDPKKDFEKASRLYTSLTSSLAWGIFKFGRD